MTYHISPCRCDCLSPGSDDEMKGIHSRHYFTRFVPTGMQYTNERMVRYVCVPLSLIRIRLILEHSQRRTGRKSIYGEFPAVCR